MPEPISDQDLKEALARLPNWSHGDASLLRELRFASFEDALAFIVRVGLEAQRRDHHPDLRNVASRVWIALTSHDAGGVTRRDLTLAEAIDAIAAQFAAPDVRPAGGSGDGGRKR